MYCLFITYNIVIPIISSVTSVNLKKAGMASRRKYIDILIDGECRNKNCLRGRGGNAGIVSKLWHDISAVFSHVYLQSFLLHDIRAFFVTYTCVLFPSIWPFSYKRAYICAQKKPIYMRYKQACGTCGRRKLSYKRHRIIPSAKNTFMYDGAEK